MSKSAVGAGTLSLPFTVAKLGLVGGMGVLTFASAISTSTLYLLARLAANLDIGDYFTLGNMAFGVVGEVIAMGCLILFLLGALVFYIDFAASSFVDFIGTVVPSITAYPMALLRIVTIATAAVIFPLAAQRDMSKLAKAAMAGMICMGYILALTIVHYLYDLFQGGMTAEVEMLVPMTLKDFFQNFSTMLFAFVNHFTMLSAVPVMIDPSPKRRLVLTFGSSGIVFGFYLLMSLSGYLHFGKSVPRAILEVGLKSDSSIVMWAYKVANLLLGVVLVLSYPLLLDPCRGTIEGAIARATGNAPSRSAVRSMAITFGIIASSTFIALVFKKEVTILLDISVAFAGSMLLFIFPAAFFLRFQEKYHVSNLERILSYAVIAFGVALMIFGTYYNIYDLLAAQ